MISFDFVRIEEELKLDYSDVLFRPKRSTLQSRKDVNLKRTYRFKYSNNEWSGIPIIAANLDGVGELGVAEKLSEFQMITCLTKQHDINQIEAIYKNPQFQVIDEHSQSTARRQRSGIRQGCLLSHHYDCCFQRRA